MFTAVFDEFAQAIAGHDRDVDLFGAAMSVSRLSGREFDPHDYARKLDLVGEAVLEHAGHGAGASELAHAIDYQLFTVLGFKGASAGLKNPINSFLSDVIDRREGIPITLSLVYMEVAQRAGLRCDGVGYPRHFIVRCGEPEDPIYIDPLNQGARLDRAELLAGLRSASLGGATPDSMLCAVTRRQILQRLLANLHGLFRESRDLERWLATVELRLRLEPWNAALVGERGMLHYRMGRPALALADLERYVDGGGRRAAVSGAIRLLDQLRSRHGDPEETE
ncbi:MAG: tetratricopeptide repeat protein [Dehalococcoidia bacterium]|nr:hypothetical protein [Chloroflexi bacterium CFX7]MCK6563758.1 transglutaminase-like domain-containing protein [Dehalococcoidia bacterium]NUQ56030.1 tetratricopeptide repeat protein [Dehalococcoidia bacterium]RIL04025.1 MAG: hypothetical protein DCC78_00065 [bacterium]